MEKKKILVRVDGSKEIGLGHVYNILTILPHFKKDEILILMNTKKRLGSTKLKKKEYKIKFFSNKQNLFELISAFSPDIIFNDTLNSNSNDMKKLRKNNCMIVNFEDLGIGRKQADLVFNPIYFSKKNTRTEFYGEKYACIRDEFRKRKSTIIRKKVKKITISFGGTDPTDKTYNVMKILHRLKIKEIQINVILGLGFLNRKKIKKIANKMHKDGFKIKIIEKPDNISEYVHNSDFTITSNGRTVFEIGAMQIPMIAIAVNSRERKHSFVKYSKGGFHIDINSDLEQKLPLYIKKMLDYENRKIFSKNLANFDLLNGINRVVELINTTFKKSY
jgi:spore coat polysaccharide biosynthesis predicted glycosyltransferase SpsG